MPFINDKLNAQAQESLREREKHSIKRASRFIFDPQQVMTDVRSNLVGQEPVLDALEDIIYTVKADFGAKDRPLAVVLLLGPTGVGKTETVKLLTKSLLGSPDQLCRIDMNTLAQTHYSAAITGSPPGYVGSKEGHTLFDKEKIAGSFSQPGIVLFDEIEKADADVVRSIMNIFDSGKLQLTSGQDAIDFSNTLVFMTSNLGAQEISRYIENKGQHWKRFFRAPADLRGIVDKALNGHFDPEFINRIDRTLVYQALDKTQLHDLVDIEVKKLNQRIAKRNAKVSFDTGVKDYLAGRYDMRYGARDIKRLVRIEIEPKIAKALISYAEETDFSVKLTAGKLLVYPATVTL